MTVPARHRRPEGGQVLAVMAIGLTAMLMMVGLILDGGNAWGQQRGTQNASDSASLAGATVLLQDKAGDTKDNTAVLAAVNQSLAANNTTYEEARYVDIDGTDLGAVPASGAIPAEADGVHVRSTRNFRTYLAGIAGITELNTGADATAVAGKALGVCSAASGCGILPLTFSVNVTDCDGNGNIIIGDPNSFWPIVDLATAKADQGVGTYEAIYPLCKVGPGGVGWLDFGCGGTLKQQIANPCNRAFDIPIWIPTSPGNSNAVENEVNAYAGKVVLIPLFDSTCRTIPASGLTQDCTDPGNGDNRYYHIPKFVAMLLDEAHIQGNNSPECNGPPGQPVGGNGGTSCLKGWFIEYVIQGPVGEYDPVADNGAVLGIQLIQ